MHYRQYSTPPALHSKSSRYWMSYSSRALSARKQEGYILYFYVDTHRFFLPYASTPVFGGTYCLEQAHNPPFLCMVRCAFSLHKYSNTVLVHDENWRMANRDQLVIFLLPYLHEPSRFLISCRISMFSTASFRRVSVEDCVHWVWGP